MVSMAPKPYDEESVKRGHKLFAQRCEFVTSANGPEGVPASEMSEIAFVGRSNVGKSSLINALTNVKGLARTSNTPGRTQLLNFFNLSDQLMLVDLPGYGYAKVSKKDRNAWNVLMRDYLRGRPQLRRVCVLIDGRHGVKDSDIGMMELLDETAVVFQIILTKWDKTKKIDAPKVSAQVEEKTARFSARHPLILATSAEKGLNIDQLRASLVELVI